VAQSIQGLGGDKGGTVAKLGEVHSLALRMGSVNKSVDGSLYPIKITYHCKQLHTFYHPKNPCTPLCIRGVSQ
jgi:hypothetical protein